jgi:ribosomal-protein-alanine N-acetyltransferase
MVPEDVVAVAEIFRESSGAAPWTAQTLAASLSAGTRGWLAQQDEEIVAALIGRSAADEFEILNLAVVSLYRRKGIAAALLEYALRFSVAAGCATAHLEVRMSNASAIALYQSRGFREIGRRKQYYQNPNEDALLLARSISKTIGKK